MTICGDITGVLELTPPLRKKQNFGKGGVYFFQISNLKKAPGFYFFQNSGQKMAGFLFFSKGRNLAWFLLVNLAIFENPQNFSRAARAGFYFFQKFPENRSGFLFFSILGGGKHSGFLKRGGLILIPR